MGLYEHSSEWHNNMLRGQFCCFFMQLFTNAHTHTCMPKNQERTRFDKVISKLKRCDFFHTMERGVRRLLQAAKIMPKSKTAVDDRSAVFTTRRHRLVSSVCTRLTSNSDFKKRTLSLRRPRRGL